MVHQTQMTPTLDRVGDVASNTDDTHPCYRGRCCIAALTPAGVGDVADAVDDEDEVAGGQTEEVPDAVQKAVDFTGVQQPRHQKDAHQDGKIQRRDGHRQVHADV